MPQEPTIGENLARLRGQAGLTQEGLHRQSGVSLATIRMLERNGRTTALMGTLAKLARALDVKPTALIGQPVAVHQEPDEVAEEWPCCVGPCTLWRRCPGFTCSRRSTKRHRSTSWAVPW